MKYWSTDIVEGKCIVNTPGSNGIPSSGMICGVSAAAIYTPIVSLSQSFVRI